MSDASDIQTILNCALEQEEKYDWLGATKSYAKALGLISIKDFSKIGEVREFLGYASYKAAMQAESHEEFKKRMQEAVANYEKAEESYENSSKPADTPKRIRCQAMVAFAKYWLASEAPEKKRFTNDSWKLTKEALDAFENAGEPLEFGRTYNLLLNGALFAFNLEWDFKTRETIIKEGMKYGEKAISFLSESGENRSLGVAYAKAVICQAMYAYNFLEIEGKERCYKKYLSYWTRANELAEKEAMLEMTIPIFGPNIFLGIEATDEALTNYSKALEYARHTRDNFMIGSALDWLCYHTAWKSVQAEDPDEASKFVEDAIKYGEEAKQHFRRISFISPRGDMSWIEDASQACLKLMGLEVDFAKKRDLLEKARRDAYASLKIAETSGYPEMLVLGHGLLSSILLAAAEAEKDSDEKRRILDEALMHRKKGTEITEKIQPFMYWNRGVNYGLLGGIKNAYADLTQDLNVKKTMLQEAVEYMEKAREFTKKDLDFYEGKGSAPSLLIMFAFGDHKLGNLLNRLYEVDGDKAHLKRALELFDNTIKMLQKLNQMNHVAGTYWKAAQVCDNLSDYLKAAKHFDSASDYFRSAAEKIPQLKDLYQNNALYMAAWSEIEKARHDHVKQEYDLAREHFEKAASLHQSSKQWSYMAPNYSAWSHLEHAEDLSRKDQCEEAIGAFEQACELFGGTKKSLQEQLGKIENPDEKQMATNMLKATDLRLDYCAGRIALEEARILDKKGDHYSSSEKYGSAAETFERINQASESAQERKEFNLIVCLSQAWQKMTRAEAEASPELYSEASQLFEDAKDCSPNEQTKMLALGHSRFCKALEAGTKFADTGDMSMHAAAEQYLESAAKYYMKAGFQKVSEYAKATELLFDAYVQMNNAKKEADPERKARFYMMTEKLLQTSAGSFMKAEHPEKMQQVLKLLDKVREERELAVSLSEVLHAPSIVSTTTAFNTPTPTQEEAVGLEKFENADIQAKIIPDKKEINLGENLDLEIELINAGKGPAMLIKVTDLIPKGFELIEKPEKYRVEDSFINLKGKRLDPLRTEEVKLGLKSKVQGVFSLKPTILYLDENGKYKSHQPETVSITVKELGIKGWLKGER